MKAKKTMQLLLSFFSKGTSNIIAKWDQFEASKFPLHTHNFFEIELIVSGSGTNIINGKKYTMRPGMLYFLAPSDAHEIHYKETISILNVSFTHNFLPDNFENLLTKRNEPLVFYTEDKEFEDLFQICKNILKEYSEKNEYFETALTHYLSILLLIIARKSKIALQANENDSILSSGISYLKLHFTESPKLETVASYVGLTPAHFTTILKKNTGLSYCEYLTELKISHAKMLLKSNRHTITDIVFASGFNSICNFNRVFKQYTNLSPSQYRKKYLLQN